MLSRIAMFGRGPSHDSHLGLVWIVPSTRASTRVAGIAATLGRWMDGPSLYLLLPISTCKVKGERGQQESSSSFVHPWYLIGGACRAAIPTLLLVVSTVRRGRYYWSRRDKHG